MQQLMDTRIREEEMMGNLLRKMVFDWTTDMWFPTIPT